MDPSFQNMTNMLYIVFSLGFPHPMGTAKILHDPEVRAVTVQVFFHILLQTILSFDTQFQKNYYILFISTLRSKLCR